MLPWSLRIWDLELRPLIPLRHRFCGYSRNTQDVPPEQLAVFLAAIFADNREKTWGVAAASSDRPRPNPGKTIP
jgi:hypothetical protein